jgi:hypothetical protein
VAEIGEIARRLLAPIGGADPELGRQLRRELTPDPDAPRPDESGLATALRSGREQALVALLARLPVERVAARLGGGDEARRHAEATLNAPHPPRVALSLEFVHTLQARMQAQEECIRLLALALVEVLHPSPRAEGSACYGTARQRSR